MSNEKFQQLLDQWESDQLSVEEICERYPNEAADFQAAVRTLEAMDSLLETVEDEDQNGFRVIPASLSVEEFQKRVAGSGVMDIGEIQALTSDVAATTLEQLITALRENGRLTPFQIRSLCRGDARLVLNDYVLLERIGVGGMGEVFMAMHRRMKRVVALKRLPSGSLNCRESLDRFRREVEAAAQLEHPNIVAAHDAGEVDGDHYLVLQYFETPDLQQSIERYGPMPVGTALDCAIQALQGLDYAHECGIVHRDIKPANLILDDAGTLKILDMGLVRIENPSGVSSSGSIDDLTTKGITLGTLDYMSPEQAVDTQSADAKSDIYSLGCTIFYFLTGRVPYPGDTPVKKIIAHREAEIPDVSALRNEVPDELSSVLRKMMAKKPESRYDSAAEALLRLQTIKTEYLSLNPSVEHWRASKQERYAPSDLETTSSHMSDTEEHSRPPKKTRCPHGKGRRLVALGVGLLMLAVFLGGIVLKVQTDSGVVVIESNEPDIDIYVDNEKAIYIRDPQDDLRYRIEVDKNKHTLKVTKDGFTAEVRTFSIDGLNGNPIRVTLDPAATSSSDLSSITTQRELAEWIIGFGGSVTLAGVPDPIAAVTKLPDGDLQVDVVRVQNPNFSDDDLEQLAKFRFTRGMYLGGTAITDAGIALLEGHPSLELLVVERTSVGDESLKHCATILRLKTLNVGSTAVTGQGVVYLESHPSLRTVVLSGVASVTEGTLKSLSRISGLRSIALGRTNVADEWVTHLTDCNLEEIILSGTVTDRCVEHLLQMEDLKRLYLSGSLLTDRGFSALSSLPNITYAYLASTNISDKSLPFIARWKKLEFLDLCNTAVSDVGIKHLSQLSNLRTLAISKTRVTEAGARELRESLPRCRINIDPKTRGELFR